MPLFLALAGVTAHICPQDISRLSTVEHQSRRAALQEAALPNRVCVAYLSPPLAKATPALWQIQESSIHIYMALEAGVGGIPSTFSEPVWMCPSPKPCIDVAKWSLCKEQRTPFAT